MVLLVVPTTVMFVGHGCHFQIWYDITVVFPAVQDETPQDQQETTALENLFFFSRRWQQNKQPKKIGCNPFCTYCTWEETQSMVICFYSCLKFSMHWIVVSLWDRYLVMWISVYFSCIMLYLKYCINPLDCFTLSFVYRQKKTVLLFLVPKYARKKKLSRLKLPAAFSTCEWE